ncbi:cob(I)yrinic acid a,c-diamide adenosyltransferase [Sulfurivermis fontis]|jgi:cob(I)alamin adenosyltransferase|uniref:cob(I)yrinic acid a,c-diamide adenosyltransferase n=1 Tax=Sulfurivermis fontis TaxID=1972068 RepID=UPI000FD7D5A5|nr:cob(I)yrinic acid a,c-diamide adenosyltransferase [Sulfurivermis fontis]
MSHADDQRHNQRMARKKAVVEERIAQATGERGVLVVNTGNGKGKSLAAFGLALRALGHGMKVGIVQFIKGRGATGEEMFFRQHTAAPFHVTGDGYTWDTQNRTQDEATARKGWEIAAGLLRDAAIDLVVLDELNIVLKYRYLPLDEVLIALQQRPAMQHVIITGRGAPDELIALADTVTEMREVKHAFKAGIKAQVGVEF